MTLYCCRPISGLKYRFSQLCFILKRIVVKSLFASANPSGNTRVRKPNPLDVNENKIETFLAFPNLG